MLNKFDEKFEQIAGLISESVLTNKLLQRVVCAFQTETLEKVQPAVLAGCDRGICRDHLSTLEQFARAYQEKPDISSTPVGVHSGFLPAVCRNGYFPSHDQAFRQHRSGRRQD